MLKYSLYSLLVSILIHISSISAQAKTPVQGTQCAKNQVVNKLTVYEDGAIEAECGPMPCGTAGDKCVENQGACRADSDVFSGMKWAQNGQSLLLRCCSYSVPNKVYVGTDLVTLGSYYTGGLVAKADEMYGGRGREYDFVVNARTEQGGVRVWVYRIICPAQQQQQQPQQQRQPQQQQQLQQLQQLQQQKHFDSAAIDAARQHAMAKSQAYEQRRQHFLKQIAENQDAPAESVPQQAEEETAVNPLQYRPPQRQRDAPTERLL